jgi:hypothetical protein
VIQTDLSGNTVAAAGATFRIRLESGPVVGTVSTDASGKTPPISLPVASYCVEQITAPPGFQLAPQYRPAQCHPVSAGETFIFSVADPPTATPTPTPTAAPTPTPSPTAGPTGELQVVKTDTSGQRVTAPGFTFNVRVGSTSGQVIATVTTDGSGTAIAAALNPATYCLEETAAPDGYQVAPAYSPAACVEVVVDTTRGRSPTTVTVADPASQSPSPSAAAAAPTPPPSMQRPIARGGGLAGGLRPSMRLAAALVGLGGLLLVLGAVMIVTAVRRQRRAQLVYEPPDTWYDSTIT